MSTTTETVPAARRRLFGPFGWPPPLTDSLALMAGVMMTTGLPPYHWTGILVPVAMAVLFRLMLQVRRPARTAWLFALAHQATLLYWMFFLDPAKSIPTRALVPVQAVATVLYVSLFYLLFGWVFRLLRDRLGSAAALALAPVLWVGMEFMRGTGEMGFPWCLAGSAWIGTPLLPLAAAAGEFGLSCATAFSAAALVVLFDLRRSGQLLERAGGLRVCLVGVTALAWIGLAVGARLETDPPPVMAIADASTPASALVSVDGVLDGASSRSAPVRVAAVQANVTMRDKWDDAKIDSTVNPYTSLTVAAAADSAELIVWAETAVPAYLRYEATLLDWVRGLARDHGVFLFTGFPDATRQADGEVLKYNSSGLFDPRGALIDQYAKHHLLPIGERMPFSQYLPFLAKVDVGQAEWQPADPPAPIAVSSRHGTFYFSGLICFESIFAGLARQSVQRGTQALVNITNDGWFGKTAGPRQHAALSRLRAAECGVPLIRCANNGISMIVDRRGEVVASAGLGRRALVIADVDLVAKRTLFVRYGVGPVFVLLGIWIVVVLVWAMARRRMQAQERGPERAPEQAQAEE